MHHGIMTETQAGFVALDLALSGCSFFSNLFSFKRDFFFSGRVYQHVAQRKELVSYLGQMGRQLGQG